MNSTHDNNKKKPDGLSGTDGIMKTAARKMAVPEAAAEHLDLFLTREEIEALSRIGDEESAAAVFGDRAREEYQKGVLSLDAEGRYVLSDFWSFMEIFIIREGARWKALPGPLRAALSDWYFRGYYDFLADTGVPTDDVILPLKEALERIDAEDRRIYLCDCECRNIAGDCGLPVRTCLSFGAGPNSFPDRGAAVEISREEARNVIIRADQSGLMHTGNASGMCNCCDDCCALFKSQKLRKSAGTWPATKTIVHLDALSCIGCGRCVRRCRFSLFKMEGRSVTVDQSSCVGCGLCVNTCPSGALTLVSRDPGA